ncbi:MAG UNVERIFIED_CONTAM: hypothetical protein LVQ98_09200 [Rickettsiaceae bacterium]|jgi:drug/metabolite transporter (DMT)-like permease
MKNSIIAKLFYNFLQDKEIVINYKYKKRYHMHLKPNIKAAMLAITSALALSISMALAKTLDKEIPTSLVVLCRCIWAYIFIPFVINHDVKKLF